MVRVSKQNLRTLSCGIRGRTLPDTEEYHPCTCYTPGFNLTIPYWDDNASSQVVGMITVHEMEHNRVCNHSTYQCTMYQPSIVENIN